MRKILIVVSLICFIPFLSYAETVKRYSTYATGGSVTATNLNGNFDAAINEMNGGLDNENADTSNGYRYYEVKGSNPAAGTEGRMLYNTAEDKIYTDDGASFNAMATQAYADVIQASADAHANDNTQAHTDYFLNTTDSFAGTITIAGGANNAILASSYIADAVIKIIKTDATTNAEMLTIEHQEHGANCTITMKGQTDAGASKSISIVCDPDAQLLNFANGDFDDVDVGGIFTAGTKTFKIDHPVDPYNKIYYHGVVESPKFGLMYDGKIKLNKGKVSFDLDTHYGQMAGTFEALVRKDTRRVFLQNNDTWDLVKGKVKNGVLTITSNNSSSNAEIDWLITGERFDPFVINGRMTDEDGNFILEVDKVDLDADDLAEIKKLDEPIEEVIVGVDDLVQVGEAIEERTLNYGNKKGWLIHPEERGEKIKKIKTRKIKKLRKNN